MGGHDLGRFGPVDGAGTGRVVVDGQRVWRALENQVASAQSVQGAVEGLLSCEEVIQEVPRRGSIRMLWVRIEAQSVDENPGACLQVALDGRRLVARVREEPAP